MTRILLYALVVALVGYGAVNGYHLVADHAVDRTEAAMTLGPLAVAVVIALLVSPPETWRRVMDVIKALREAKGRE